MTQSLRAPLLAAVLFAVAFALIPKGAHAAQISITITDSGFSPANVTINPGDTVTWKNNGAVAHTVTSDTGAFDSQNIPVTQSFAAIFNGTGTYSYHCSYHSNMKGTITVASGSAGAGGTTGAGTTGTGATTSSTSNTSVTNNNQNTSANTSTNANTSSTNTSAQSTNAAAEAALRAKAQMLLAQIAAMQAQYSGSGSTGSSYIGQTQTSGQSYAAGANYDSSSCPLIGRTLKRGVSGDDVTRLQQFLARDPAVYPEGSVTGYYGALTERSVQAWQIKYHIVSSGDPDTTGFGVVGPRTAAAISILCTTGSYGGVSGPGVGSGSGGSGTPDVGGYITVTPVSGAAPLTVSVQATVNTTNSCAAATYGLDFGDGTAPQQITVQQGSCVQLTRTFPHLYQNIGTYTISLSAAGHSTTATVLVNGGGSTDGGFTPGLPKETFNASPTNGTTPLKVTFSGVVTSNDLGFCAGGCGSVLDFGDGTSATVNLPAAVGGWLNYSVDHTYTQTGGYVATLYQGGAGASQPKVGKVSILVNPASSSGSGGGSGSGTGGGGSGGNTNRLPAPSLVASVNGDPLTVQLQFSTSGCTSYSVAWGDSSAASSGSCGGSTQTLTHAYAAGGSYIIDLARGSQHDDASITISN